MIKINLVGINKIPSQAYIFDTNLNKLLIVRNSYIYMVNMTQIIKVTSKGQVTLPADIRKKLRIDKDTYIAVEMVGDYIIMKKVGLKLKELSEIVQKVAKDKGVSEKDIAKAIKESRKKVWA